MLRGQSTIQTAFVCNGSAPRAWKMLSSPRLPSSPGQTVLQRARLRSPSGNTMTRSLTGALLLLGAALSVAWASDVVELTDSNFDDIVPQHAMMLIEFFAPWCGHCKKLAPEYEEAATKLKGTVSLAKVDCTANSETCNKYGVSGYPTLKIFRNGEESGAYDGPRNADGIVSTMKKQAGPASVTLQSVEEFEKFIGETEASVLGFFRDLYSDPHTEFLKAANTLREKYRFAHTDVNQLVDQYDNNGEGVVLFRPPRLANKFEESTVTFPADEKITSHKIKKFIQDNLFGICPHPPPVVKFRGDRS